MTTEQVPSNQGSPMQELREIVENQTDGRQFLPVEMALLRRVVATHEPAPVRGDITLTSKGVCSVCECPDQGLHRGNVVRRGHSLSHIKGLLDDLSSSNLVKP